MAIKMRRGNKTDLDASKLSVGEFAVVTDNGEAWVKLTSSVAKQLATLTTTGKLDQMPTAADVGARENTWLPSPGDIGAVPITRKINGKPLSADVQLLPSDLGITIESGTWTPYIGGAASTIYTTQVGRYYRIGKMVTVTGNLEFTSLDGVANTVMIYGLPFTPLSSVKQAGAAVYGLMNYSILSSVFIESGVIRPVIQRVTGDWYTVLKSDWRFPGTIWFTVTYEIA